MHLGLLSLALLCASLAVTIDLRAQGSLTPPGTPGPTQKSLQEIWDRLGAVEQQNTALQNEVATLQTSSAQLQAAATALQTSAAQQQLFLAMVFQDQLPWRVTTVDAAGDTGEYTSLAFGPDGQPAISYYDRTNGDLRLARFNGTSWSSVSVDAAGDTGHYTSLAFNPAGQPAISYYDSTNGDLRYAWFTGTSWTTSTLDITGSTGAYTSLAFAPNGRPTISYYDETNSDLRLTQFNPANSQAFHVTVDAAGDTGFRTSLAMPDEHPAIAYSYYDGSNLHVRFVRHSGSNLNTGWNPVTVDPTGSTSAPSLAFGPDGQPVIAYSYYDGWSNFALRFARFNGTSWIRVTIDAATEKSYLPSLAFGPDGQPAIAYDNGSGDLRFARFNGGSWTTVTVAINVSEYASTFTSLAFGPDGQPAISYFDANNGDLRFAQRYVPTP